MKAPIILIVLVSTLMFSACSGDNDQYTSGAQGEISNVSKKSGEKNTSSASQKEVKVMETQGNVTYKIDLISAKEFIEHKGERVAKADIPKLKKESVLILEMQLNEGVKSVLESKNLTMSKDDAVSYLMSQIKSDVSISQGKDSFDPYEVLYDGHLTGANKLRVFMFIQDLDLTKTANITFYDRLFGAGLIKLKH